MLNISREVKEILLKNLDKILIVPKVEDVDKELKNLVKADLQFNKQKTLALDKQTYITYWDALKVFNITDKFVDSRIGIILKEIRIKRNNENVFRNNIRVTKNVDSLLKYFNMSDMDNYLHHGKWTLRPTSDLLRRDIVKLIASSKLSIEEAKIHVLDKHRKQNEEELNKFIDLYFK